MRRHRVASSEILVERFTVVQCACPQSFDVSIGQIAFVIRATYEAAAPQREFSKDALPDETSIQNWRPISIRVPECIHPSETFWLPLADDGLFNRAAK